MTEIALPIPARIPSWVGWIVSGLLGLGAIFTVITSNTFQVTVNDPPAFPGCEGWGCDTTHGRGGSVCIVTNTNDSGSGSLRDCLVQTGARIVIFRVSGTITLSTRIALGSAESNVAVFGQTAPGDGIAIVGANGINDHLLNLSFFKAGDSAGHFSDGVFQHLRFRHNSDPQTNWPNHDNVDIHGGTNHVVFDHNSFTLAGDESYTFWASNAGAVATHDITFSHNIQGANAEPNTTRNKGPLLSGGGDGTSYYNLTFHHNFTSSVNFRDWVVSKGTQSGTADRGYQFINNVHYASFGQHYNFTQNQYTGCSNTYADIINDYFLAGPTPLIARTPVLLVREKNLGDTGCPEFYEIRLYLNGNTWREHDHSIVSAAFESTNTFTIIDQGFGDATGALRGSPLTDQPQFPVTITTAAQAYQDIVVNEDVGATKPALDSMDQSIIDGPIDSTVWESTDVPPPNGTGSLPTLTTFGVPTDTDNDGVPDAYETSPLGTDPNVFENQAVLDHDGDGYSNIEDWVHSL
jgi:hypothetical protein